MINFYKQFAHYYKDYKLHITLLIIGLLLLTASTAGSAYIMEPILDDLLVKGDKEKIGYVLVLILIFTLAKSIGQYMQMYFISYIGQDIVRRVRDEMLNKFLSLDMSFFYKSQGGELISRITNDIQKLQLGVSQYVTSIIRDFFQVIALLGMAFYQSPKLTIVSLVILPLAIYPLSILGKKMKKISHSAQEKNADITSILGEIFNNIDVVKANSTEKYEEKKFADQNYNFFRLNVKAVQTNQYVPFIMENLAGIAFGAVVLVGTWEVTSGNMTVGELFSFITALLLLLRPIKALFATLNSMQESVAAGERIKSILDMQPQILSGSENIKNKVEKVEFKNVSLKYDETPVLSDVNIIANKGETVALVGDSGGGKSSLINMIIKFYEPNSGEIYLNNQEYKTIDTIDLRSKIALVSQHTFIFSGTIAENVAYGEEQIDRDKVKYALEKANAMDFISKLPDGIDNVLEEFGANVSGGQKQRISIARAIYKDPEILILDEATSALDNKSEKIIQDFFKEYCKDKITFTIAHRLSTIQDADKILVFKDGKIVCEDTHHNLLNSCDEYIRLNKTTS